MLLNLVIDLQTKLKESDEDKLGPHIQRISSLIQSAILTVKGSAILQCPEVKLPNKDKIAPGKTHDKQLSFHATSRKTGRKRKALVLK